MLLDLVASSATHTAADWPALLAKFLQNHIGATVRDSAAWKLLLTSVFQEQSRVAVVSVLVDVMWVVCKSLKPIRAEGAERSASGHQLEEKKDDSDDRRKFLSFCNEAMVRGHWSVRLSNALLLCCQTESGPRVALSHQRADDAYVAAFSCVLW